MSLRCLGILTAAMTLGLAAVAAEPPSRVKNSHYEKVRPERLRVSLPGKQGVTQFLAADRKGKTYLLRGDTLDLFRLDSSAGGLHRLGKLACKRPPEGAMAAAMDSSGSSWVLSPTGFDLAICDTAEEKRPPGWTGLVSSVAFSRTGPLAAVVPFGSGLNAASNEELKPRVLALDRERWTPVVKAPFPRISRPAPNGWLTELKAATDTLLCSDPKGFLWLASWNTYSVEKISSGSDSPTQKLVVGSGKIAWKEFSTDQRTGNDASSSKRGLDPAKNQGGRVFPKNVIRSILCHRDGLIYLLVSTEEGIALDRYDPGLRTLDRILLAGVEVGEGPMTAVLTSDELLMAGRLVQDGMWRARADELEAAPWKPVVDAKLNGKPLS